MYYLKTQAYEIIQFRVAAWEEGSACYNVIYRKQQVSLY
jgi:hypothetical protein